MLKIKLKSLAEESRIIRKEELRLKRAGRGVEIDTLRLHRHKVVREEARATHVAYGFLKGMSYDAVEPSAKSKPNWDKVVHMVKKYGDSTQLKEIQLFVDVYTTQ